MSGSGGDASARSRRIVGLIVNPIAGMGGSVGLKGTDGPVIDTARALGAVPQAGLKAVRALRRLSPVAERLEILTCPDEMGARAVEAAGLSGRVVVSAREGASGPEDTQEAVRAMAGRDVDLLLFAGGDGTARDVADVVGPSLPALGIPAGVKVYSGVFATTPENAGNLAAQFLGAGQVTDLREAEVVDVDEAAVREGRLSASLYGYLRVPSAPQLVAGAKSGSARDERALGGIAHSIARGMEPDCLYVIGPGTTTRTIVRHLGLESTLLGVDVVCNGQFVGTDLSERQLLALLEGGKRARIIVGVIGGQGYIFGRGNQQIGPQVIKKVGRDNILVVATAAKLLSLTRGVLLVDTGDPALDRELQGFIRVVSGNEEETLFRVQA